MDISIIAVIIAVGTAIALFFQIWFQKKQLKQTENNQYDETLRKSMRDLYEVYRTDFEVKTKAECELFATRILDILAVLEKNTIHLHQQKFGLILLNISKNIKPKHVRKMHCQIA